MLDSNDSKVLNAGHIELSRRSFVGGVGLAVAGTLLGSSRAVAANTGKVVVYSTYLPVIQKKLSDAFTAKAGITVQSLRLVNNVLAQRFIEEQKSKQFICDVITLGNNVFFETLSKQGLLADIDDIPGTSSLPATWRPGKQFVMTMYSPDSIGYNTKTVTGASIPKSWQDILKPEFAGQIIIPDPRANDTITAFLVMLQDAFGDDYLRKLGEQKLKLVPTVPQGVEMVIAGDAKIILPCLAMNLIPYQGTSAPIAITSTPSPTDIEPFYSGIAANAPNKEEARKWFEFVLSREGQEILCKDNGVSPLGQIPGSLNAPANVEWPDLAAAVKKAPRVYDLLGLSA
jgi:iron(III) transport system substrate-binding protein